MAMHLYSLFGLTVASEFAIPWAPLAERPDSSEVVIRRGAAEDMSQGGFHFAIVGVARYRILEGREILVDADPGASDEAIRLYLLGSALGVLLHQRRLLVLHANAIVIDGAALLFMGPSGAGKSTLAAWFASRGLPVLTDDICAVEIGADGGIAALPGLTRLRLAEDARAKLGVDGTVGEWCAASGKLELGLTRQPAMQATPLRACYLLSDEAADAPLSIRQLTKIEAVEMLMANTYRGVALRELGGSSGHLAACVRVAGAVPCFEARRTKDWARFDLVAEALLAHGKGLSSGPIARTSATG